MFYVCSVRKNMEDIVSRIIAFEQHLGRFDMMRGDEKDVYSLSVPEIINILPTLREKLSDETITRIETSIDAYYLACHVMYRHGSSSLDHIQPLLWCTPIGSKPEPQELSEEQRERILSSERLKPYYSLLTSETISQEVYDKIHKASFLALGIRGDWRYAEGRLDSLIDILDDICMYPLSHDIEGMYEDILQDGRYLRDCWLGSSTVYCYAQNAYYSSLEDE